MENFVITRDDVKVMSSAVVKLIPNTIKKQIISDIDGEKTIKVEADYEISTTHLEETINAKRPADIIKIYTTKFIAFKVSSIVFIKSLVNTTVLTFGFDNKSFDKLYSSLCRLFSYFARIILGVISFLNTFSYKLFVIYT